ncbi:MAG: helix-turn-helix domain-containing protein [Eubacteriales bacterium]|nr:helix-turn-helix domain-containing protein [Eubacteriales bacterium]
MISTAILQSTLENILEITGTTAGLFDANGKEVASNDGLKGIDTEAVRAFIERGTDKTKDGRFIYSLFTDEADIRYAVVADSNSKNADMTVKLLLHELKLLSDAYKEKLDKDNFVKNLILDNLLQIDIYNRARKLHIDFNVKRAVFIIESQGKEAIVNGILDEYARKYPKDLYTTVDENNVVLVHELTQEEDAQGELKTYSEALKADLEDAGVMGRVSYGAVIDEIKEVSKSYKEAKLSLDVGKIFYEEKQIVAYNNLGIGRLIYQLPLNLCRMFIKEIFDDKTPDQFDKETLTTIAKFFENNLNVSETSRQLFIHRNTLVYRLDKIQKNTGLDLRAFDDAITFKIALMVVKYMEYMKKIDY